MEKQTCAFCGFSVNDAFQFCPHCGKSVSELGPSTSIGKQIFIYLVSFFLPPFGLRPGIQYLKSDDPKAKRIGIAAIMLTILSILISIWVGINVINGYKSTLNDIEEYENLGL